MVYITANYSLESFLKNDKFYLQNNTSEQRMCASTIFTLLKKIP